MSEWIDIKDGLPEKHKPNKYCHVLAYAPSQDLSSPLYFVTFYDPKKKEWLPTVVQIWMDSITKWKYIDEPDEVRLPCIHLSSGGECGVWQERGAKDCPCKNKEVKQ